MPSTIGGIGVSATALADADLIEVEQGAASKKATLQLVHELLHKRGSDVASAGTLVLGEGSYFHITGTTTITDIDFTITFDGRRAVLVFDGVLTITHNATTLVCPGGVSIKTAPGDSCTVVVDSGDNVRITQYERASGQEITNPSNISTTSQAPAASATTLLTGSLVDIPPYGVQVKSRFLWHAVLTKTAAGTVAVQFLVKIGTAGTTGDGTVLTFALPTVGTAVIDEADVWFEMVIVGPLTSSCVVRGTMSFQKRLAATGWTTTGPNLVVVVGTPATFNATVAALKAHLSIVLGASYVVTAQLISCETTNL